MSHHYSDEEMDALYQAGEPITRACRECGGKGIVSRAASYDYDGVAWARCSNCQAGRVPHEGEPEIEVWKGTSGKWHAELHKTPKGYTGSVCLHGDTQPLALAAAREALK